MIIYISILILQGICIYHAFRNSVEQRWYWIILLLPVVGCIMYLVHAFSNRSTVRTIEEGVREAVSSSFRIEQLQDALRHSENVTNKMNLAEALAESGKVDEAMALYQDCLQGFMSDDPQLRMRILQLAFIKKDYSTVIAYGKLLENEKSFRDAEERIAYAWALHYEGNTEKAETIFQSMDRSFSNYKQRFDYCRFLKETDNHPRVKSKLSELMNEFEVMKSHERRYFKEVIFQIREMQAYYQRNPI